MRGVDPAAPQYFLVRARPPPLAEPGSGERGLVAVTGFLPVGYYKDEAKTASTFVTIDGERYSIPGDYATVAADGSALQQVTDTQREDGFADWGPA